MFQSPCAPPRYSRTAIVHRLYTGRRRHRTVPVARRAPDCWRCAPRMRLASARIGCSTCRFTNRHNQFIAIFGGGLTGDLGHVIILLRNANILLGKCGYQRLCVPATTPSFSARGSGQPARSRTRRRENGLKRNAIIAGDQQRTRGNRAMTAGRPWHRIDFRNSTEGIYQR
jgi:hypothetical protein